MVQKSSLYQYSPFICWVKASSLFTRFGCLLSGDSIEYFKSSLVSSCFSFLIELSTLSHSLFPNSESELPSETVVKNYFVKILYCL